MRKLIEDYGFYPSRSELIRVAIRDYIIKTFKLHDINLMKIKEKDTGVKQPANPNLVQIPIEINGVTKIKTFKIIREA